MASLPDEAVAAGAAADRPDAGQVAGLSVRDRLGGTEGNEILTSAAAVVLVALLVVEGVTVVRMRGLVTAHMFVGLVLIPPVLLKLASTGYRFARYYTGARAYRVKGPPLLPLRLLAPVLVATTIAVLATGVVLMAQKQRHGPVMLLHKASFIVWLAAFGIHFLAYLPRVVRSLRADWSATRRRSVPGSGARATLVAATLGGGVALALALLPVVHQWHGGHH